MRLYRTEIDVPPDHYVCLQLPDHFPAGRATVTVHFNDPADPDRDAPPDDSTLDREDIEWWEEFEGERGPANR